MNVSGPCMPSPSGGPQPLHRVTTKIFPRSCSIVVPPEMKRIGPKEGARKPMHLPLKEQRSDERRRALRPDAVCLHDVVVLRLERHCAKVYDFHCSSLCVTSCMLAFRPVG